MNDYYEKMKNHYLTIWTSCKNQSSKLQLYNLIKEKYEIEAYLTIIKNFEQRKSLTKLRISNHKLAIETGRYGRQKVPAEQRLELFRIRTLLE